MDYRPKKGLDIWLNDKGFYRKHVAMDETCLFRAISDQLYNTQIYHEYIRNQCIEFANKNRELFVDVLKDSKLNEHLDKLHKHFVVCGDIEMQLVSKMVERDFIIIDAANFTTVNVTNNGYDKFITLCKMKDDHYDSVCLKEYVDNSGFCQALVYKLLYEKVFEFENVDDIVQTMLYPDDEESDKKENLFDAFFPAQSDTTDELKDDISKNPPFPYKVAKALDPNQYRNIQFDAWNQTRKELRIKDWYLGGDDFKVGTKCLLVADNNTFECYIQDLKYKGQEDICLVHVVEWASKEIVKREELMPIPNAKPWPLPYAIARNKNVDPASTSTAIAEISEPRVLTNNHRRRKNKRRAANNHNNNAPAIQNNNNNRTAVSCLEGCPLVVSPPTQYVDENANVSAICKEQPTFDENENYSVPFETETCMLPLESTYSEPLENNADNFEEDQPYTGETFASEADWNNYQALLPAAPTCAQIPVPYPAPYVMPSTCMVNLNPPIYMATEQYNTVIREENADNKVTTVYSKYVEKTYCSNNNSPVNYQETNYSEHEPQMPLSPTIHDYEYNITPIYPTFEPQFAVQGHYSSFKPQMPEPNYPEYDLRMPLGPIMPVPLNLPVTPVSPMPFYPQPLHPVGPLPTICPCQYYVFVNPGPLVQPNVADVPQTNEPLLMPNELGKINPYIPNESNFPNEEPYTGGYFLPPDVSEHALMPSHNNNQSF